MFQFWTAYRYIVLTLLLALHGEAWAVTVGMQAGISFVTPATLAVKTMPVATMDTQKENSASVVTVTGMADQVAGIQARSGVAGQIAIMCTYGGASTVNCNDSRLAALPVSATGTALYVASPPTAAQPESQRIPTFEIMIVYN